MRDEHLFIGWSLAAAPPTPASVNERANRLLNDISDSQQMIQYEVSQLRELSDAFYNVGNSTVGEKLAAIAKQIESHNGDVTRQASYLHKMALSEAKEQK